jgi:hypothetical protein
MRFERPTVTDHGSIVQNTFYRCPTGTGVQGVDPPKNYLDLLQDKFGECSHS